MSAENPAVGDRRDSSSCHYILQDSVGDGALLKSLLAAAPSQPHSSFATALVIASSGHRVIGPPKIVGHRRARLAVILSRSEGSRCARLFKPPILNRTRQSDSPS